ncbi:MAG: hypothetical protein IPI39_15180 [Candidatus Obscuribacter sp.]|nr:hypothetical protein [Candidatus Obscuribacter sp.]
MDKANADYKEAVAKQATAQAEIERLQATSPMPQSLPPDGKTWSVVVLSAPRAETKKSDYWKPHQQI